LARVVQAYADKGEADGLPISLKFEPEG
jgi:hypothetical protein